MPAEAILTVPPSEADTAGQQKETPAAVGAPLADPGPLGLAGFALTTFVLSLFNAGLIEDLALEAVVLPLALFYGGLVQLLAGMWEFRKNNTFGAVAFSSYGAFWLSFAAYVEYVVPGLPPSGAPLATGVFLLAWTVFTACMWPASLRTTGVIAAVFTVLLATFALLAAGQLAGVPALTRTGGWLGLLTAALAWYGCAAAVTNSTWQRTVLPTYPLGK